MSLSEEPTELRLKVAIVFASRLDFERSEHVEVAKAVSYLAKAAAVSRRHKVEQSGETLLSDRW